MKNWCGIALILLGLGLAGPALAATDSIDSTAGQESVEGGWLTRTMRRYFGNNAPTGDHLDGLTLGMVDRYNEYVGKTIAVVFVQHVARFDSRWDDERSTGQMLLSVVTKPFQTYTAERTVRQYLLFAQGEPVDPYLIADTERMLRNLDYIEDVRIRLVPVSGEEETVAIVVEIRDRWPFGAAGTVKDVGRYEASLYSSNIGGIGLRFENRLLYREGFEPATGYQGLLRKDNVAGSFVAMDAEFEDSYRKLHRGAGLVRELSHNSIKWVGGLSWRRTRERDNGGIPDDHEIGEFWLGDVIRLYDRTDRALQDRPVLVPAVLFNRTTYLDRGSVSRDYGRNFHNRQNYLLGLTYQRNKYYKTSYLFEMGETENLPSGLVVKLSGGYQDGEFNDRAQGYWQTSYLKTRRRGDVSFVMASLGGFFRNGEYEDGSLILRGGYITSLSGGEAWRARSYATVTYHRAINRASATVLDLGNSAGLRGMTDNLVEGNQRLVGNFEYRLFTPWTVMGFRFMLLGFLDVGAVADENTSLVQSKIYGSSGLAVRVQNPDLVLTPVQIRVAFLNSIDDKGVQVGIRIGGPDSITMNFPGTRPGGFEFR